MSLSGFLEQRSDEDLELPCLDLVHVTTVPAPLSLFLSSGLGVEKNRQSKLAVSKSVCTNGPLSTYKSQKVWVPTVIVP